MKPDTSSLLNDLTAVPGDSAEALIRALRRRRHRKAQFRAFAVSAIGLAGIAAGIRFFPRESSPSPVAVEPARPAMLTKNELLDSFGDQPVALVTWPDGRQQLLAIAHAPVRRSSR